MLITPFRSWVENDIIFNNLIWRNVKESVGEEYKVPDYEEDLVYVDFHAIERLLHKGMEYYRLIRVMSKL